MLLEILLWFLGAVLCLVGLVVLLFRLPSVQTYAAQKVTVFLASKLNTNVRIGRFTTDWQNSVVLKDFYLEARNHDTLIFAGRLGVDLDILALYHKEIKIKKARLENAVINLNRAEQDSLFNISMVKHAFGNGKKGEQKSGIFYLKNLALENVRFNLRDAWKGNFIYARIGTFSGEGNPSGEIENALLLGKLKLKNSSFSWQKTKLDTLLSDPAQTRFSFTAIDVKNVSFDMLHKPACRRYIAKIGNLQVDADKIALENSNAELSRFKLQNSSLSFIRLPQSLAQADAFHKRMLKLQKVRQVSPWAVWLMKTEWRNITLKVTNLNEPALPAGLDVNRLHCRNLNLNLTNVYYSKGRVSGRLEQLQLLEKCGFRIKHLQANVKAGPEMLELTDFILQTNNSRFNAQVNIALANDHERKMGQINNVQANVSPSRFVHSDLLFLAPDFQKKAFFRKLGNNVFTFKGLVSGNLKDVNLKNVSLRGWSGTQLHYSGNVKNLQLEQKRLVNLQIKKLITNRADLNLLTSNGKGAPAFRFPDQVSLSGNLQSSWQKLSFQHFHLTGTNGLVLQATGSVNGPINQKFADLNIKNLIVTRQALLNMLPPGAVTPEVEIPDRVHFAGTFQGSGLASFATNGTFTTTFGNVYTNIKIQPVQQFSGHISLDNFNLGKLLKQENMLGPATGKADFQGKGFKVKTMQLHYKANVKKFVYKNDTYHNIRLEGDLNQKIYQLRGNLANAALQGLGHKLKGLKPKNMDLKKMDPTRLIPKSIEPKKMIPKFLRKKKKEPEPQEEPK